MKLLFAVIIRALCVNPSPFSPPYSHTVHTHSSSRSGCLSNMSMSSFFYMYLVCRPSFSSQGVRWLLLDLQAGLNRSSTLLSCSASPPNAPPPLLNHAQRLLSKHRKIYAVQRMRKHPVVSRCQQPARRMKRKSKCFILFFLHS